MRLLLLPSPDSLLALPLSAQEERPADDNRGTCKLSAVLAIGKITL